MNGPLKLYRTARGPVLEADGALVRLSEEWDTLVNRPSLVDHLRAAAARGPRGPRLEAPPLAPAAGQEVWGAGVTYDRSRTARIDESQAAGGGGASFYDRVYAAERPELFFKCAAWRLRGPDQPVRLRRDARWSVPEPELALCISARGEIVGYTIGNDLSARDIEAENPLYLPQAKIWDGACALGPALLVREEPLPPATSIALRVMRAGAVACEGSTTLARMRRPLEELVAYLYRETSFPAGCLLLTGTGIVPPAEFALRSGDDIEITVPAIGTLRNRVE
ncbi:MAG: fumarylacetoacetate hydrolase family protein [Gemmatimonadales bacterium]|jgi:2-dehydro-3-deoxy-D-arabinonate dehydratase